MILSMRRGFHALALCGILGGALGRADLRAGTGEGSCLESFELENFQPVSPTAGQPVATSSYRGRATLVVLLASW